ncbi:MAG TPA: sugar ABC transporter ATP-binding protein, partial [Acetobacteraceae bacterium]|nr:sugar ABC transporter ATP-binding protein [Acetobacteraceae bacterium]
DAPALLDVRGVTKNFPGVTALAELSLSLRAGEVHGLIGQNGAGKSTLINILSGIYPADSGTIAMQGRPVGIRDAGEAASLGIATVFQELSLLPNLTVAQNLALGREPRRLGLLDARAMRDRARHILERLKLDVTPDAPVTRLSLAERQMLEIAKALASEPRLLILDEPTAPLGQRESALLFAAIAALRQQGVAILYVSHRFAEVLALCDVATVLRNGRHVVTTPLAGWSEARLTEAMIGTASESYRGRARQPGATLLAVRGLRWGGRVRDVDLTVRSGEIVGLTGLLGAGQNEIARLIGGDLMPDAGRIAVDDRVVAPGAPHDAIRAGICLLTEERKTEGILPNLSVRQNIAVASLARRRAPLGAIRGGAEAAATAGAARDFGVVAASLDAPIRTLSGGNQQKALLARWGLADSAVFVFVEPTRGVDVGARADIYRRLDRLARDGKAILVVSSDLAEVLALAERILVVRDGRIAAEATPAATSEEQLNLLIQGAAAA